MKVDSIKENRVGKEGLTKAYSRGRHGGVGSEVVVVAGWGDVGADFQMYDLLWGCRFFGVVFRTVV